MRAERFMLCMAVILAAIILGACALQGGHKEEIVVTEKVDLVEFEIVRASLYDYAMEICTELSECDGGCFYNDVEPVYADMFKTYRVPGLEVLLTILDQIDEKSCLWDVYDNEDTLSDYYTYREEYEQFFN